MDNKTFPDDTGPATLRPLSRAIKRLQKPAAVWARQVWLHKWSIVGLTLLVGAAALGAARLILGPEVVTVTVVRGTLIRTVVASGHVETPFRVEIGSQIIGTVQEVLVEEGQAVKRDQPVIALESSELEAAVVQAEGAVAQAQARMRQLQELTRPSADEALKQAKANLINAQAAYDRTAELARTGSATRAALDDVTKNLDVARTLVRVAELQVYTSSPGGSDYVMAETQLSQAMASLRTARSRLGYAMITAPRDGVLITRNVERGAVVQPGKALLVLAPAGDIQLVLQIDEKNIGLVALREQAIASADAYPDRSFPAVVTYVNPSVDITRASVQVKLTVPNPPAYLRQDMTVSVDIEIARKEDALIVPARAVHDATSGTPWVIIAPYGRARQQPVTLGFRANTQFEVVDGLREGDAIVPLAAGVKVGQRIRPVRP